jgi:HEAT repeat protein
MNSNLNGWRTFPRWLMQEQNLTGLFNSQLSTGQAAAVTGRIQRESASISALMELLGDAHTPLSARIGIGVVMEDLANSTILQYQTERLGKLSTHRDTRIRADACHYLSLTGSEKAIPYLQARQEDQDDEVREVAQDALNHLLTLDNLPAG